MAEDKELINRLTNRGDITPADLKNNVQNIETLTEGTSYLTYELSSQDEKKK